MGLELLAFSVVELTITVHHAHLPPAEVGVSDLLLRDFLRDLLGPDELAVTIELTEVEVASVLATVNVDEVAVAVLGTETPLTRVL